MDSALVSAFVGAQVGRLQLAAAGVLMRMNAEASGLSADVPSSVRQLVDAADQSAQRLANLAAGMGTNLDIRV
jgi:hypothetical protein